MNDTGHDLTDDELESLLQDLAGRSIDATARRLAAERPAPELTPAPRRRVPRRVFVYGAAAAAALVALVFGVAAFGGPDAQPVQTAAPPSSSVSTTTAPDELADPIDVQVAADALVAAEFDLTIGSLLDDPPPDLTPVIDGNEVLGYLLVEDQSAFSAADAFVVYGPDGTTIRGVWDAVDGFVPIEDEPVLPETLGGPQN